MKIIITKDYEELSRRGARVMLEAVKENPYAVLGLATGTTPLGLYAHMIVDHEKPFKDVEVGFDGSPTQVLAVCSLYAFLQR